MQDNTGPLALGVGAVGAVAANLNTLNTVLDILVAIGGLAASVAAAIYYISEYRKGKK